MVQLLRPTSDVAVGSWRDEGQATTDLYLSIDETSPSDADFAESGPSSSPFDAYVAGIGAGGDPISSADHVVRYRLAKSEAGGDVVGAVVELRQGATTIATWTHGDVSDTAATQAQILTAAEADAITDYAALRLATRPFLTLFRDQFTAGLDAAWNDTGANYTTDAGRLVMAGAAPGVWTEPLEHTAGIARATGRALVAWRLIGDRNGNSALGWASAAGITDPRTDGHAWVMEDGVLSVSQPAKKVVLSGTPANAFEIRPMEYGLIVALNATGALYLLSTFAAGDGSPALSRTDPRQIPTWPDAMVIWREDVNTDATLHPFVNHNGPLQFGAVDDVRVVDVADWSADGFGATLAERFPMDGALSGDWSTSGTGTWAVTSGKLGVSAVSGPPLAWRGSGLTGDGRWRWKFTYGGNVAEVAMCIFRVVDGSNYMQVRAGSAAISLTAIVAGAGETALGSTAFTWVVAQTYDIAVVAQGNRYKLFVDGTDIFGWMTDANSRHLTGAGVGARVSGNTTATWDDILCDPLTLTLPTEIQDGLGPAAWTVGATLASDDFTDANGTTMTTHDANWTSLGGTAEIQSNRASTTNGAVYAVTGDDFQIEADLVMPSDVALVRAGFYIRYQDADNFCWIRCFHHTSQPTIGEIETLNRVGGVDGSIRKVQFTAYWTNGSTVALRSQVKGDVFRVWLDGEPVLAGITTIAAGDPGLYIEDANDNGTVFDNFLVKAVS